MRILFNNRREKIGVTVGVIALATILVILVIGEIRQRAYIAGLSAEMGRLKAMSVHDRVVDVITLWGKAPTHPPDTMQLEVVWSNSSQDIPFYPEAAQLLEQKLKQEFRDSRTTVMQYRDIRDSAKNPSGSVTTVAQLARLVRANYEPQ